MDVFERDVIEAEKRISSRVFLPFHVHFLTDYFHRVKKMEINFNKVIRYLKNTRDYPKVCVNLQTDVR